MSRDKGIHLSVVPNLDDLWVYALRDENLGNSFGPIHGDLSIDLGRTRAIRMAGHADISGMPLLDGFKDLGQHLP